MYGYFSIDDWLKYDQSDSIFWCFPHKMSSVMLKAIYIGDRKDHASQHILHQHIEFQRHADH